ncbi:HTH domain-containing protein [Eubacterium ramulus]|uniref:HTH domain-containing protein n=1 Tax=Eubacterium ramulus TaxID=39490 RepID=UPI00338FC14B
MSKKNYLGDGTDIKELIIERKLTVDTLSRITKINQQWFIDFISQKKDIENISEYDIRFLTDLTSVLKMGIDFDCDSRLKSIIETLIIEYEMDAKTLSLCSGANEDVMCRFLLKVLLVLRYKSYSVFKFHI